MLFERFEEPGLAHYSYAVGCPAAGRIAIIDPKRDVDTYLAFAEANDVEIAYVLETHIHADYASGATAIVERTGADLLVSGYDVDEDFEVQHDHRDLSAGDAIQIGAVRIEARHTPGHTPEHLSYVVYDEARSADVPMLMLTGDFLFVGSLGRPDLLGEAAKRDLAHKLFQSVRELEDLPDSLEIHPAHGAGSMCGAGMSGRPYSTLGFERVANPYLDPNLSEPEFVERILSTVPPFPAYYRRMKRVNADGPRILAQRQGIEPLDARQFQMLAQSGHLIIDTRDPVAYGEGHIAGAYAIGAGRDLSTWASWVVPYDRPILLVVDDASVAASAVRSLIRVGLDDVVGYLAGGIDAWATAGLPLVETRTLKPDCLPAFDIEGKPCHILDVRNDEERDGGGVTDSLHIPTHALPDRVDEVPRDRTVACLCGSGYRSTVACSLLERSGHTEIINVEGGMLAWKAAGLPTEPAPTQADAIHA